MWLLFFYCLRLELKANGDKLTQVGDNTSRVGDKVVQVGDNTSRIGDKAVRVGGNLQNR